MHRETIHGEMDLEELRWIKKTEVHPAIDTHTTTFYKGGLIPKWMPQRWRKLLPDWSWLRGEKVAQDCTVYIKTGLVSNSKTGVL